MGQRTTLLEAKSGTATSMYLCTLKVRGDIALGSISGAKVRHRLSQAARANHWHGREDLRSRQGKGAQRPLGGRLSTGGGCHKPCQGPIHSEQLPSTSTGGTYSLSLCRGTFNVALYNYSLPGQDILVTSQILDYKEEKRAHHVSIRQIFQCIKKRSMLPNRLQLSQAHA